MTQNITIQPGETVTITAAKCPDVPPPNPNPPPTGPGCGDYSPMPLEMAWPVGGNVTLKCPAGWTKNVAVVVHFKSGTTKGDTATFQPSYLHGPYQNMVASISDAPGCNICTAYPPVPPILGAQASQTPVLRFIIDTPQSGPAPSYINLKPNTDYWITMTWQAIYGGPNSCVTGDCGSGVRFDFNN